MNSVVWAAGVWAAGTWQDGVWSNVASVDGGSRPIRFRLVPHVGKPGRVY